MCDNEASPTEAELNEWVWNTDANRHRKTRAKIADWAGDIRIKNLCKELGKTVDEIYENGILMGGIDPKDFEVAPQTHECAADGNPPGVRQRDGGCNRGVPLTRRENESDEDDRIEDD